MKNVAKELLRVAKDLIARNIGEDIVPGGWPVSKFYKAIEEVAEEVAHPDYLSDEISLELSVETTWHGGHYPQTQYSPAEYPEPEITDVKGKFKSKLKPMSIDYFLLLVLKELNVERKYQTKPVVSRLARNKSVLNLVKREITELLKFGTSVKVTRINEGKIDFDIYPTVGFNNPFRGNKIVFEPVLTKKSYEEIDEKLYDNYEWFEQDSYEMREPD